MAETVTVQSLLKGSVDAAHRTTESTMADVDNDLANQSAPGRANPIGSTYAHSLLVEDAIVNGVLQGKQPLWMTDWAGKTGADKPMPFRGLVVGDLGEWYHTVQIDLAAMREYAKAVYANTEAYLASASDETLSREVASPFGAIPAAMAFTFLVTGHANNLCGEISAIKGVNGLKGYPF